MITENKNDNNNNNHILFNNNKNPSNSVVGLAFKGLNAENTINLDRRGFNYREFHLIETIKSAFFEPQLIGYKLLSTSIPVYLEIGCLSCCTLALLNNRLIS
jgi:hypothetical protein